MNDKLKSNTATVWLILALPLLLITIFRVYPLVNSIINGFMNSQNFGKLEFCGIDNFVSLFKLDPSQLLFLLFRSVNPVTLLFVFFPVVAALPRNKLIGKRESLFFIFSAIPVLVASTIALSVPMDSHFIVIDSFYVLVSSFFPIILFLYGDFDNRKMNSVVIILLLLIGFNLQRFTYIDMTISNGNVSFVRYVFLSILRLHTGDGSAFAVTFFLILILSTIGIVIYRIIKKSNYRIKIVRREGTSEKSNSVGSLVIPIAVSAFAFLILFSVIFICIKYSNQLGGFDFSFFFSSFFSSVIIIGGATALQFAVSFFVGRTLGKYNFKGKVIVELVVYGLLFITANVLLLPLYDLITSLWLLDTYIGVILTMGIQPFGIILFSLYYKFDNEDRGNYISANKSSFISLVIGFLILFNVNQIIPIIMTMNSRHKIVNSINIAQTVTRFYSGSSVNSLASLEWLLGILPFLIIVLLIFIKFAKDNKVIVYQENK